MKAKLMLAILVPVLLAGVALAQTTQPAAPPAGEKKASLMDNLQAAYNGESNAHARYVEFARKADQEGYAAVAGLFRAAARSEEIHTKNHAEVIKKMNGTPKADLQKPDVKSTKENLEAALKGETYETETMYPDFLKLAFAEKNLDGIRTFNYSLSAETQHVKLFRDALDNLESWKAGKKDFFVCPTCGYTVTKVDFERCPVCYSPAKQYEKIN